MCDPRLRHEGAIVGRLTQVRDKYFGIASSGFFMIDIPLLIRVCPW